jgi:hypothetical protein
MENDLLKLLYLILKRFLISPETLSALCKYLHKALSTPVFIMTIMLSSIVLAGMKKSSEYWLSHKACWFECVISPATFSEFTQLLMSHIYWRIWEWDFLNIPNQFSSCQVWDNWEEQSWIFECSEERAEVKISRKIFDDPEWTLFPN